MSAIKFIAGLLFVSIFSIAIIGYVIGFGIDNQSEVSLDDEMSSFSTTSKSDLTTFKSETNSSINIFTGSTFEGGDESVASGAQFKLGLRSIAGIAGNILSVMNKKIFGTGTEFSFILTTVVAFMGLIGGFYAWYLIRGGKPD